MRNPQIIGTAALCALVLGAGLAVTPAPAQETSDTPAQTSTNICLRSNDIRSWDVENDRTLIVTDRRQQQYKLGLVGTCVGLDNANFQLGFESLTELSCLRPGDRIHYRDFTFGPERCTISSVEPYTPPATPPAAEGADAEG